VWSVWHTWGLVTLLFLVSLPVAAALAWGWARLRARRGVSARDALAEALMVAGTAPWLGPLLAYNPNSLATRRVFVIPFVDLVEQISKGPRFLVIELGGNLAVFAALGFFLPVRYRIGLLAVIGTVATASVGVEIAQYVFDLHRVSSIDDVTINTTGAALAALASRRWWRRRRRPDPAGTVAAAVPSGERPSGARSPRG
jgi:hypothetical protein